MITFSGITLDNVENPIIIDQLYNGGDSDKAKDHKVRISTILLRPYIRLFFNKRM